MRGENDHETWSITGTTTPAEAFMSSPVRNNTENITTAPTMKDWCGAMGPGIPAAPNQDNVYALQGCKITSGSQKGPQFLKWIGIQVQDGTPQTSPLEPQLEEMQTRMSSRS